MPKKGEASLEDRLHRIQGQVRGIEAMVQAQDDMAKVISQIQAIISGLESVKLEIIKKGVKENLDKSMQEVFNLLK